MMIPVFAAVLAGLMVATPLRAAEPRQPRAPGIESEGYVWNKPSPELEKVLRLKGDVARGRLAYEYCQGCHLGDGAGRPDGSYPQLAAQHVTVLIKQMVDIREGRRDNQKMFPYASEHVISAQDIADLALYLERLLPPRDNGKGAGLDLERGRRLYERDCKTCHGAKGGGDKAKFHPAVAGQHFRYMVRQMVDVQAGRRRNANPKMAKAIKPYDQADIEAVCDYLSRLELAAKPVSPTR